MASVNLLLISAISLMDREYTLDFTSKPKADRRLCNFRMTDNLGKICHGGEGIISEQDSTGIQIAHDFRSTMIDDFHADCAEVVFGAIRLGKLDGRPIREVKFTNEGCKPVVTVPN